MLVKGVLVPLLILRLYGIRNSSPVLASFGLGLVVTALTVALGQWLGWMAGKAHVQPCSRGCRKLPINASAASGSPGRYFCAGMIRGVTSITRSACC